MTKLFNIQELLLHNSLPHKSNITKPPWCTHIDQGHSNDTHSMV